MSKNRKYQNKLLARIILHVFYKRNYVFSFINGTNVNKSYSVIFFVTSNFVGNVM